MKTIFFKLNQFPHLSETFILAQIITAIKSGFKVKIIVSELLDIKTSKQEDLIKEYKITEAIVVEDFKIPKSKILRLLKFIYLLIFNSKYLPEIISFYKNQKKCNVSWLYQFHFYRPFKNFDIAHVQYGTNVKPLDDFKKMNFLTSKLIVSFHGHDAFFPINGFIPNNGYYTKLFEYGNCIVANTPYLANVISELGCPSEKLKVIPVGVDTKFFTPYNNEKISKDIFYIISVGRLEKVKGHEYALQVAELLQAKRHAIRLTIVGDGSERANLEKLIREKKLDKIVHLVGKKSPEQVRTLLRESDAFVFTSVATNFGRRETQGLATLEAQACGVPVVVFNSGGVKYTLQDTETGYIVPEYDVTLMAHRIEQLIINPDLRKKLGVAAKSFVEKQFSQTQINQKWDALYNHLMPKK